MGAEQHGRHFWDLILTVHSWKKIHVLCLQSPDNFTSNWLQASISSSNGLAQNSCQAIVWLIYAKLGLNMWDILHYSYLNSYYCSNCWEWHVVENKCRVLMTKLPGSKTEMMDEQTTNTFEANLHFVRLSSSIGNKIQLANRCQHPSVFSTTNLPLLWCYKHELTYREYLYYH